MKEFRAQDGGRYTYIDDIMNLQDLALAFNSIFDECDNFIISGCQLSEDKITAGFVYISGKIRYFPGSEAIQSTAQWPQYIYEDNTIENVSYADASDKEGRYNYGCAIGAVVPTTEDPITGLTTRGSIAISNRGDAMRMEEAFFRKYALSIHAGDAQTVKSPVTFAQGITISSSSKGYVYKFEQISGRELIITANGMTIATINPSSGAVFTRLSAESLNVSGSVEIDGSIKCSDIMLDAGDIYDGATQADNGQININMIGYEGKTDYARDLVIGNGKGDVMAVFNGARNTITLNSNVYCNGDNINIGDMRIVQQDATRYHILWKEQSINERQIAAMGADEDGNFRIKGNSLVLDGNVSVYGNLGFYDRASGSMIDVVFPQDFVSLKNTVDVVADDVKDLNENAKDCVRISKSFADIGEATSDKSKLCENIGALYEYGGRWITFANSGDAVSNLDYIKYGRIVHITGMVTIPTGFIGETLFQLPVGVGGPKDMMNLCFYSGNLTVRATLNTSGICTFVGVDGTFHQPLTVQVSITYLI